MWGPDVIFVWVMGYRIFRHRLQIYCPSLPLLDIIEVFIILSTHCHLNDSAPFSASYSSSPRLNSHTNLNGSITINISLKSSNDFPVINFHTAVLKLIGRSGIYLARVLRIRNSNELFGFCDSEGDCE